ncbi:ROK family protein [Streptomyces phaeoluteigriseus]
MMRPDTQRQRTLVDQLRPRLLRAVIRPDGEPVSRTRFADLAGISGPTAVRVARSLIDEGLLVEGEPLEINTGGRREIALRVNPKHLYVGVVVEDGLTTEGEGIATQALAAPATLDGSLAADPVVETVKDTKDISSLVSAIHSAVSKTRARAERQGATIHGIGVTLGGHVRDEWVHHSSNIGAEWDQPAALGSRIESLCATDGSPLPVLIDNDANAIARNLLLRGGMEPGSTVVLLKQLGIGAANLVGDAVFTGAHGMAPEFGHITVEYPSKRKCRCGNYGCLEAVATPSAVAKRLQSPGHLWKQALLAHQAREQVRSELVEAGGYLGIGLSSLINLQDPSKIYLFGVPEFIDEEHHPATATPYLEAMRTVVKSHVFPSAAQRFSEALMKESIDLRLLPSPEEAAVAATARWVERVMQE